MQLWFLFFCSVVSVGYFCVPCIATDRDVLEVLSEGYRKNRESFTNIDCRFVYTRGLRAETVAEAVDGHWQRPREAVDFDGLWFVKDGDVRFELKCRIDAKNFLEKRLEEIDGVPTDSKGEGFITVPCLDTIVLSSRDSFRLTHSGTLKVANIFPKGVLEGELGIRNSPFDMGVMGENEYTNPYRHLQDCINGRFIGRYIGIEEVNGRQLEIVALSTKASADQAQMKFGFDPRQGFLATYIADFDETTHKPVYEAFVLEAKRCSNDRYFPVKSIVIWHGADGKYSVNSFFVTDLDVDTKLDPDLICFEIPAGTQISVPSFKNQWMKVEKSLSIVPGDIERLQQDCIDYARAYIILHGGDPDYEPPDLPFSSWFWLRIITTLVGFVMIALGLRNIIRRWQVKNNKRT